MISDLHNFIYLILCFDHLCFCVLKLTLNVVLNTVCVFETLVSELNMKMVMFL